MHQTLREAFLYDVRLMRRNIQKNLLTKKALQEHLEQLSDRAEEGRWLREDAQPCPPERKKELVRLHHQEEWEKHFLSGLEHPIEDSSSDRSGSSSQENASQEPS